MRSDHLPADTGRLLTQPRKRLVLALAGLAAVTVTAFCLYSMVSYLAHTSSLVRVGRYGVIGPKTRYRFRMTSWRVTFPTRTFRKARFYGNAPHAMGVEVWAGLSLRVVDFDLR